MSNEKSIKKAGEEPAFAGRTGMGISTGLSKREFMAAMAMQGLCVNRLHASDRQIAIDSIYLADQLIQELNDTDKQTNKGEV